MDSNDTTLAAGEARHRRALLSTLMASGFGYLMTAISFVTVPLYLKWLGVEAYGQFLTLWAFMGYLNFADAGLNWGALILIGIAHGRRDDAAVARLFRHATVLAFLSAGFALLLAVGVYYLSRLGYRLPMFSGGPSPGLSLLLIGLKSAFMLSTSSVMAMAYGLQEGYWFTRIQGYFQVLGVALMLAAAFWARNVEAVVWASTLASAVACVVTLILAARRYTVYLKISAPFSLDTFRLQLRTGAKGFLLQGSRLVRTTLPVFMIASYEGTGTVPTLTLPLTLLGVAGGFLFNWSSSLQSAYGEAWSKGDKGWIAASVRHVIERGLGWLLLASCLILSLGQWFVRVWTSGRVVVPMSMLASAVAIAMSSWMIDICIFALVGINRQRRIAFAELLNVCLAAGACCLLCVFGRPTYIGFGILAAALLTSVWVGRRDLVLWLESDAFEPERSSIIRFAFAAICTYGVLLVAKYLVGPASSTMLSWAKMSALGAIGSATFVIGIATSGLKSDQWPGLDWMALIKSRMARWSPARCA